MTLYFAHKSKYGAPPANEITWLRVAPSQYNLVLNRKTGEQKPLCHQRETFSQGPVGWRSNFKEIGSTLSSSLKIHKIVPPVKLPFAGTWQTPN